MKRTIALVTSSRRLHDFAPNYIVIYSILSVCGIVRIDRVILFTIALNSIYNFKRQYGAKLVLTPLGKDKKQVAFIYFLTFLKFYGGFLCQQ